MGPAGREVKLLSASLVIVINEVLEFDTAFQTLAKAVSLGAFPHHRSRYYLQAGELACFCIPLNLKTQLLTELRWYCKTLFFPDPCSLWLGRFLFTSKFVDDLKGSTGKNVVPSFSFIKSPILLFVCFFRACLQRQGTQPRLIQQRPGTATCRPYSCCSTSTDLATP